MTKAEQIDKDIEKAKTNILLISNNLRIALFNVMRWSVEEEPGDITICQKQHEALHKAWLALKEGFDALDRAFFSKEAQNALEKRIWEKTPVDKGYEPDFYDKTHEHGFDQEGNDVLICTAFEDEVTDREVKKIFG